MLSSWFYNLNPAPRVEPDRDFFHDTKITGVTAQAEPLPRNQTYIPDVPASSYFSLRENLVVNDPGPVLSLGEERQYGEPMKPGKPESVMPFPSGNVNDFWDHDVLGTGF